MCVCSEFVACYMFDKMSMWTCILLLPQMWGFGGAICKFCWIIWVVANDDIQALFTICRKAFVGVKFFYYRCLFAYVDFNRRVTLKICYLLIEELWPGSNLVSTLLFFSMFNLENFFLVWDFEKWTKTPKS